MQIVALNSKKASQEVENVRQANVETELRQTIIWRPRWLRFRLATLLAAIALAAVVFRVSFPPRERRKIQLSTGYLAAPLQIPTDPRSRKITRVEITSKALSRFGGRGSIVLDESLVSFNDFGDASVTRHSAQRAVAVEFKPIEGLDSVDDPRQVFHIVFPSGRFENRLYLVASWIGRQQNMLLVLQGNAVPAAITADSDKSRDYYDLSRLLPLNDLLSVSVSDSQEKVGPKISLKTYHFTAKDDSKSTRSEVQGFVRLSGTLNGPGSLSYDKNQTEFTAFGDGGMSTLMGYLPTAVKIRNTNTADPAGRKRRLYEIVVDTDRRRGFGPSQLPLRCQLVLSATADGPHRLIVRDAGTITHVLPLYAPSRRRYLQLEPQVRALSTGERQAIAEIRKLIGDYFRFRMESEKVVSMSFSGDSVRDAVLSHVADLPSLKSLRLSGGKVSEAGLEPLAQLTELESLSFRRTPVSDDALQQVRKLKNLIHLQIYDEYKSNPESANVSRVSDKGLEALQDMTNLHSLSLCGDKVTDAGLEHLVGLTGLKSLHFHETKVSIAGMAQLSAALPRARVKEPAR